MQQSCIVFEEITNCKRDHFTTFKKYYFTKYHFTEMLNYNQIMFQYSAPFKIKYRRPLILLELNPSIESEGKC
jgi:hypothetical protein